VVAKESEKAGDRARGLRVSDRALKRVKATASRSGSHRSERATNVQDAFGVPADA
jgi:predicted amidophosphoribosyltransferase